ncbi:MAG TPA: hypothetical protein PLC25_05255 [Bacilli bacterium]|nr:hypothetical protein [Bacilli bacterium]
MKNNIIKCLILTTFIIAVVSLVYLVNNKTYSYVIDSNNTYSNIKLSNINVDSTIDNNNIEYPTLIDNNNINFGADLKPNEVFSFTVDVVNDTNVNYKLSSYSLLSRYNDDINSKVTLSVKWLDGDAVKTNDVVESKTKRTMVISVSYDKYNEEDLDVYSSYSLVLNTKFNID